MEGVLASFNQFDNDVRGERTRTGLKKAVDLGRWPFFAPIGYLNSKDATGTAVITPDPIRAPLIRMAYEKYATGLYTKQQVLEMVTVAGLRTRKNRKLAKQELDRILANPIYAGRIKINVWSERKKGNFESIVTEDLFERVQAILSGRKPKLSPFQRHHPDFPLRAFIRCSQCGQVITGSWSKGRNQKCPYYHCAGRCRGINLRKEKLEAKFTALLERMQIRQEYVELFRKIVLDQWQNKSDATISMLAGYQRELRQLNDQREQLIDAFVYAKAITQEIYNQRLDKLEQEIALARMRLHDAQLDEVDLESVLSFAEKFLLDPARLWLEMSLEQRQRFQLVLFPKGIELMPNGEVGTAVTSSVFEILQPKSGDKTQLAGVTGLEPATSAVTGQRSEPVELHPQPPKRKIRRAKSGIRNKIASNFDIRASYFRAFRRGGGR